MSPRLTEYSRRPVRADTFLFLLSLAVAAVGCGDDEVSCPTDGGSSVVDAGSFTSMDSGAMLDAQLGNSADAGDAGFDPTDELYRSDSILDVQVTLSPADWDALRVEGRNLDDNFSGCLSQDFAYTLKQASISVGGQQISNVAVRKKGFLGSISARKPSLRIELDQYVPGQTVSGAKTLVLNNNLTDASLVHQCMAYSAFRAAGVAAPRCSFARVTVNGTAMGIYTNVEPIKKPFLKRVYGEDQGNLYEGSSPADFRTDMLGNFEKKTNELDPGKPELEALAALLLKSDDELLAGLDALLDVDEFIRFWATETLLADWDSYSSDLNNFYVYADPNTKKLKFIPWGPDDAFTPDPALLARPATTPQSVYATSRLSGRLYKIVATRERYRQALRDQLAQTWNEGELLAEVDRLAALLGAAADATALENQRQFIRSRRAVLQAELDAPAVDWPIPERSLRVCTPSQVQTISGTFKTTWGAAAPAFDVQNALSLAGMPQAGLGLAGAGPVATPSTLPDSNVTITIAKSDMSLVVLQYQLGLSPLSVQTVNMHGFETFGILLAGPDATHLNAFGLVGEGSISFTEAASTPGGPVSGSFSGKWVSLAPATPPATP